jgi:protein TonB
MRTVFYAILLFSLPVISFSQNKKPAVVKQKPVVIDEDKIFQKVESDTGPVDPVAWNKYIQKNAQLPDSIAGKIPKGIYKVVVKFIVDKDGYIGQVETINDPGFGLAERAVRMIRNYNIAWRPASQCGRTVKSYRQQTIIFAIAD